MKITVFKDIFLFALLTSIAFITLFYTYSGVDFESRIWLSATILFIFAIVLLANYWKNLPLHPSLEIGIASFILISIGVVLKLFETDLYHGMQTREDFIILTSKLVSTILILVTPIWIILFFRQHPYTYLYISATTFVAIFLKLLFSPQIIILQVFDTSSSIAPNLSGILGGIFGSVFAAVLQKFTKPIHTVVAICCGIVIGAILGSTMEVLSDKGQYKQAILIIITTIFLIYAVFLFKINEANFRRFKRKIYYFLLFSLLAKIPTSYGYNMQVFQGELLIFTFVCVLSISLNIIGQFFLLSIVKEINSERKVYQPFQVFSLSYTIYIFLVISATAGIFYAMTYKLSQGTVVEKISPSFVTYFTTFSLLIVYNKIFQLCKQASQLEKSEHQFQSKTSLCKKHHLRSVKKRKAFFYSSHQCPIANCGKEHLVQGVKQLIGCISDSRSLNILSFGEKMYIHLWNPENQQASYGEIDVLEIHYVNTFSEEDYSQAIQSVVGKIYNSMPEHKRKQILVEIQAKVILSEGSKRLLRETFPNTIQVKS
ncbi:MAG: hypothetical protein AAF518_22820 [Spirochaetota bacterium]